MQGEHWTICLELCGLEYPTSFRGRQEDFEMFLDALEQKNTDYIIQATYSSKFDIMAFNKWYFSVVFNNSGALGLEKCVAKAELLADTEKNWQQGANLEIIFLANMFKLMKVL